MKFSASASTVSEALAAIMPVIERRSKIPVLLNVMIDIQDSGVRFVGTNLDQRIEVEVNETDNRETGRFTVDAITLAKIMRSLKKSGPVTFVAKQPPSVEVERWTGKYDERSQKIMQTVIEYPAGELTVACGDWDMKMPTIAAEDFPQAFKVGAVNGSLRMDAQAFREWLTPVRVAVSTEETRYYLNGIYLNTVRGDLRATATDGHRLVSAKTDAAEFSGEFGDILPRLYCDMALKMLHARVSGSIELEVFQAGEHKTSDHSRYVALRVGNVVTWSKLIDGNFPDYDRVIPQENSFNSEIVFDRPRMMAAIKRVTAITCDRNRAIKLAMNCTAVAVSAASPEYGASEERVPADSSYSSRGGVPEIGFNGLYFSELCQHSKSERLTLRIQDPGAPACIVDPAKPDTVTVLMPMRV